MNYNQKWLTVNELQSEVTNTEWISNQKWLTLNELQSEVTNTEWITIRSD